MKSYLLGIYVVVALLIISLAGCQPSSGQPRSDVGKGSLSPIESVGMTQPAMKSNCKVGSVLYEPCQVSPDKTMFTAKGLAISVSVAGQNFKVVGMKSKPVTDAIILINEASRNKNLANGDDYQLFENRLKELFVIHTDEVKEVTVTMNEKPLSLK